MKLTTQLMFETDEYLIDDFEFDVRANGVSVCTSTSCSIDAYDASGYATYSLHDKKGRFSDVTGRIGQFYPNKVLEITLKRAPNKRLIVHMMKQTYDQVEMKVNASEVEVEVLESGTDTKSFVLRQLENLPESVTSLPIEFTIKRFNPNALTY